MSGYQRDNKIYGYKQLSPKTGNSFDLEGDDGDGSYSPPLSPELLDLMNGVLDDTNIYSRLDRFYKRQAEQANTPKIVNHRDIRVRNGNPYTPDEDAILLAGGKPEGRSDNSIYSRRCVLNGQKKIYNKRSRENVKTSEAICQK